MHTALPETADRGPRAHRAPGRCRAHTSRKIPVRPSQCCHQAVRTTSTVGLASGPPGGRRAASTLDRATPTVCHMGQAIRQSSRRHYPEGDVGQTGDEAGRGWAERAAGLGGAGGGAGRSGRRGWAERGGEPLPRPRRSRSPPPPRHRRLHRPRPSRLRRHRHTATAVTAAWRGRRCGLGARCRGSRAGVTPAGRLREPYESDARRPRPSPWARAHVRVMSSLYASSRLSGFPGPAAIGPSPASTTAQVTYGILAVGGRWHRRPLCCRVRCLRQAYNACHL